MLMGAWQKLPRGVARQYRMQSGQRERERETLSSLAKPHGNIGCVSIQGPHPSRDALYEGVAFAGRESRTEGRASVNETVWSVVNETVWSVVNETVWSVVNETVWPTECSRVA